MVAARLVANYDYVDYLHSDVRQGFGNAVMMDFGTAWQGDFSCLVHHGFIKLCSLNEYIVLYVNIILQNILYNTILFNYLIFDDIILL